MIQQIDTLGELTSIDLANKSCFLVGSPASGKSTIATLLHMANKDHVLIRTDSYMDLGFYESMYAALEDYISVRDRGLNCIMEGVQCNRILRKLVENNGYLPEVVIILEITEQQFIQTYTKERDVLKMKGAMSLFKGSSKILEDLTEILPSSVTIIKHLNKY